MRCAKTPRIDPAPSPEIGPENVFVAGTIAHQYPSKGLQYLPKGPHGYRHVVLSNLRHAQRYLKAFDVYVSPSVKEGFSWAILEAMAAQVPVAEVGDFLGFLFDE